MPDNRDGVDFDELNRQEKASGRKFEILETLKAGERRARVLDHPLDRFLRHKTSPLTQRRYDAGMKLYEDHLKAHHNPSSPSYDGTPAPTQYFSRDISDAKLNASRRYRRAMDAVGVDAEILLKAIVIDEMTLEVHGRNVGLARKMVMGALVLALDQLAEHYGLPRER